MATTTNFGWETPDDTDLVKDGAAAIRTALGGVDTSFVDLKGGTTGQVLAKASGTDLDYTWTTPTTVPDSYGFAAGKNKVINGDFGVWQRGTSFTVASDTYTADRFLVAANGGQTMAFTQQTFTAGTAPVSGYEGKFFYQYAVTGAGSGNSYNQLKTRIEGARTLAGQTATISFWAKGSASYNITTVGYQNFGTGGSPSSAVLAWSSGNLAVTTSWQRFSYSFTMPSVSGKTFGTNGNDYVELYINMPTNQTSTTGIWGVQLEAGSVATAFQTATGTIQGELSAAQRYYYRATPASNYSNLALGHAISTTGAMLQTKLPTTMRTRPTAIEYGGTIQIFDGVTATNITTLQINQDLVTTTDIANIRANVSSGLTQYRPYQLSTVTDATAYIGFSAEL
jgi:hypothetical protein